MADVPEPEYDEQVDTKPQPITSAPAASENLAASTSSVSSTSAPVDAAVRAGFVSLHRHWSEKNESLRQQVAAQITSHSEVAKTLTEDEKKEIDARSVHVAGVDYSVTNNDLQHLFEKCGEIVRVKILTDKMGKPKGFAYIEFAHVDSVARALELTDSALKSRKLTVTQKRTNIPGMRRGGHAGGAPRGGFMGFVPVPYGMMPQRGRGGPFRSYQQRGGRGRSGPY